MCHYTLERRHFAEDEKEDDDSYDGDGPEERREPLWCGHRLGNGFYGDIRKIRKRKSEILREGYISEDSRPLGKEPSSGEPRVRMNDYPTASGRRRSRGVNWDVPSPSVRRNKDDPLLRAGILGDPRIKRRSRNV